VTRPHTDFYEQGIDLFNEGRFFECHEAWEEIWKRSDGEPKLYYQGLIQAAVAILHAQRGNLEGARSLYEKASTKLDQLPPEHMGLAVGELRTDLRQLSKPQPAPTAACSRPRAYGGSQNQAVEFDEGPRFRSNEYRRGITSPAAADLSAAANRERSSDDIRIVGRARALA